MAATPTAARTPPEPARVSQKQLVHELLRRTVSAHAEGCADTRPIRPGWADALGPGPWFGTLRVLAGAFNADGHGVVQAQPLTRQELTQGRPPRGALVQKILWFFSPAVVKPDTAFVIRGVRLDGLGKLYPFDAGVGKIRPIRALIVRVGARTLRFNVPSESFVTAPGCYAYQIDGPSFSDHFVLRLVPARVTA